MTGDLEPVIGLEVHAQLLTRSKMFCGCATTFGVAPNSQTCPVCQGMPGTLPVINRRAIELATRTALALHCRINAACRFARKHYYYPDMPKNYQISQYEEPLAEDGWLEVTLNGASRRVGIQRLHLEEDVGKLIHEGTLETAASSLVDFNRAGVPLMETVSRPEIRSPEEAAEYLKAFRSVLLYLGVCDGNMEEGSFRCDANISLRPRGADTLGTKVEIKNLNSFRNVRLALEFEAKRQATALARGERVVQETRLWDADRGYTRSMRSKEFAHDYRYFPEPDLVPIEVEAAWVEGVRGELPELAADRRRRFTREYDLRDADAEVLTQTRALGDYFEAAARIATRPAPLLVGSDPDRVPAPLTAKHVANWVTSELLREISGDDEAAIKQCLVTPENLAELLRLIQDGTISGKMAKDMFQRMLSGQTAKAIVEQEGLRQVADPRRVSAVIDEVLAANPRAVEDFKKGKKAAAGALVGQVMKATQGKANPALVNSLLQEKLAHL